MSKPASAAWPPAARNRPATRTSEPTRELKLYRVCNPDFYEKAVAALSKKDAPFALGTANIEEMVQSKLLKTAKRRPGVVFRKLAGLRKDGEAWE